MRRFTSASLLLLALAAAIGLPAPAAAQTFIQQQISTQLPDLTASLATSSSTPGGGDQVTYTLTVQNVGQVAYRDAITGSPVYWNAPANGISVLQSLPQGATFRSVSATGGF